MTHRIGQISRRGWVLTVLTVIVLVAAGLVALRMASASGATSSPGVTSNEIVLGSHQPLTGPAAPGYSEISAGAQSFFKYVNEHGGVYGRQIKYDVMDDQYDPVESLKVTQQLVTKDKIFAMVGALGTPTHEAVVDYLNQNGVPDLFVESGCSCFDDPVNYPDTYGYTEDYKVEGKILGQYTLNNYPGQKVAYLLQDDDLGQYGQEGLNELIPPSEVVTQQSYDSSNLTQGLGTQIFEAQASGAQVVIIFGIPAAVAIALLTAYKLNYHPTFVVSNVGGDPSTLGALLGQFSKGQANIALAGGVVSDTYIPAPTDLNNPWVRLFKAVHDKYEPTEPFDFYAISGMTFAYSTYEALHDVGPNLTRAGLLKVMNTEGSTFQGPNLSPYAFSTTDHDGFAGAQMDVIANGVTQVTGPVYVTDNHDAPVTTYNQPHPLPPTSF